MSSDTLMPLIPNFSRVIEQLGFRMYFVSLVVQSLDQ